MIEISLGKLVLLALIALIVLGPEKLPGAARTAGALLRRIRSGWENVRAEVERELEVEEIRRAAREAAAHAEAAQNAFKDGAQQVHEPLQEIVTEASALMRPKAADPISTSLPVGDTAIESAPEVESESTVDDRQTQLPLGEPLPKTAGEISHDHA